MALTRAQLLAGDGGQGYVLPGQVQGVSQGAGVLIANNGQISVDASTVTGLVKLNSLTAFNGYIWPNVNGANGTVLTTNSSGVLSWTSPAGFAVVTVSSIQPSPSDVGELWYDCTTGYLKVFQNCVNPQGWTNVAQPGLPVEPANTSAVPGFVRGLGTTADPYECTVATVASASSLFIVNSVTVIGLAPYQYVPIVDLNAFTNGGRFHFTSNVADASGILKFKTVFIDQPPSLAGTNYTALIQVGYSTAYIEAFVNVINPLILLTPGSVSGQPSTNSLLTYTQGTASGGVTPPPLSYNWVWEDDLGNVLQPGGFTYLTQTTDLGRQIFVRLTVNDSAVPPNSVTGISNAIGPISYSPIPSTDWSPTPTDGMDYIPGGQSGTYSGPGTSITTTGCVEAEVNNNGTWGQGPFPITSGQNLAIRWSMSSTCGGAPSGTVLTGTLSDGINTNDYTVTVDRLPASFGFNSLSDVQPNSQHVSASTTITGINTTAYITLAAGNTAPSPLEYSKDGGTNWFVVPSAPSTSETINNNDSIILRFTTGAILGQLYTAVINIGDGDNVKFTSSSPGFRVTNAINPIFPNTVFTPAGGPNAAPVTVNLPLQSLYGKASATWADGNQNLTATGALLFQVNGSGYAQTSVPIINGDTIDICWDLTQVNAAANGATLTGNFTNGLNANSYNLVIDRNSDGYDFTNLTNQLLNTPVVSNTVSPVGFNVPVQLTYTLGTPNTLTTVLANIGTTGFNPVPTTGTGLYVNPGQNIQLKATTGVNFTTPYTITTTLGAGASATDVWQVDTGSTAPSVVTPSISSPNNGATGVATTVNVSGTAYINQNGAGTQASSDWQIYQAIPVQPKTSAITNVGTGAGNTKVTYSDRFTGGMTLFAPQPTPGQPYLASYYNTNGSIEANPANQGYSGPKGAQLSFDGSTGTAFSSSVYTTANDTWTGWYPSTPVTYGTSVEVWGQGVVRTTVNGTPGPEITLTPGAWNIVNIGSGNLEALEWKSTFSPSSPSQAYATIYLNAIRVDGTILTDASLGEQSYTSGWATGTGVAQGSYQGTYTGTAGGRQGTMVSFDGNTATSYTATLTGAGIAPFPTPTPAAPWTGWYPLVPIPVTTSVRVWGGGVVRAVINGTGQTAVTLTAGAWNVLYIGSGNLTGIEWEATPVSIGFGGSQWWWYLNCNAVEVNGTILTDASLGQAPYSTRFVTQQQFKGVQPWGVPGVSATAYFGGGGGMAGPMVAFDGNTATTYNARITLGGAPSPSAPLSWTGWYPTVPITFGTSVEIWGTGVVRAIVNGVPQTSFTLTSNAFSVLAIGSGVLNGIEWEATRVSAGSPDVVTMDVNAIRVDGVILTDRGTTPTNVLTLTNNTNLSSFAVGQTVREITAGGAVGDATGVITSINSGTPSITVQTTAGTWTIGSSIESVSGAPVDPGPPTTSPPNPAIYTAIVNVTGDTSNLTSYPLSGLANNKIFYARVQYNSNLIVTSSGFSAWSKFTTV